MVMSQGENKGLGERERYDGYGEKGNVGWMGIVLVACFGEKIPEGFLDRNKDPNL